MFKLVEVPAEMAAVIVSPEEIQHKLLGLAVLSRSAMEERKRLERRF